MAYTDLFKAKYLSNNQLDWDKLFGEVLYIFYVSFLKLIFFNFENYIVEMMFGLPVV